MAIRRRNAFRTHRNILYRLKRRYRQTVNFYIPTGHTVNNTTGKMERDFTTIVVGQAVVLPERVDRSFVEDLAYIAANRNFTSGGYFDRHRREILVDKDDMSIDLTNDTVVKFGGQRYIVRSYVLLENVQAYYITVEGQEADMPVVMTYDFSNSIAFISEITSAVVV